MNNLFYYLYAFVCFGISLAAFLYLFAFVANLQQSLPQLKAFMPKSLDFGPSHFSLPLLGALSIDLVLIAVFGLQHSLMARPSFKEKWGKILPKPLERSTYALFASIALGVLFLGWQPLKIPLWDVSGTLLGDMLFWASLAGWGVVAGILLSGHFELFGLGQVYRYSKGMAPEKKKGGKTVFGKTIAHPRFFGFLFAFWAVPVITLGHLVFSLGMSLYLLIGKHLEKRNLNGLYAENQYDGLQGTIPAPPPLFRTNGRARAKDVQPKKRQAQLEKQHSQSPKNLTPNP